MKKTMKRLSALLLAAMMLLGVLNGCGSKDTPASNNTDPVSDNGQAAKQPKDDEVITLKVWGFGYTTASEDMALVSEAASKITREKLGFDVEIVRYSDSEKLNLAMNSGEEWDLVSYHTYSGGLPTLVNNGMALPIDDLAAQYGQDAIAAVGEEMLNAGRMNGVLYSIPSIDVWANSYGLAFRTDMLEEAKIDPSALKTWDDLHEACLKIKELHPDKYIVTAWQGGGMQKTFAWDNLGTGFWDGLGILENCSDSSTTVVNMYETDSYRELWPNQTIAAVYEGVDPEIWTINNEFRASAAVSPALGFKFDSSGVMNEITACNNVIAKYETGLRWGELDPAEALPKLNKELYDAGLQTIIDAKQEQLDAFLGK